MYPPPLPQLQGTSIELAVYIFLRVRIILQKLGTKKTRFHLEGKVTVSRGQNAQQPAGLPAPLLRLPGRALNGFVFAFLITIITMVMVVEPLLLRLSSVAALQPLLRLTATTTANYRGLTCRLVPQIPLHLRESHFGQVQNRSESL